MQQNKAGLLVERFLKIEYERQTKACAQTHNEKRIISRYKLVSNLDVEAGIEQVPLVTLAFLDFDWIGDVIKDHDVVDPLLRVTTEEHASLAIILKYCVLAILVLQ